MIVRIRFGRGTSRSRRTGKNAHIAVAAATLGTLASISCATLGVWRLGQDIGWAGDFAFTQGVLSHWQVWLSAAAAIQLLCLKLAKYGHMAQGRRSNSEEPDSAGPVEAPANS
jgi:hypothetical protein